MLRAGLLSILLISVLTVPIKSDKEVSDADLKNHHLLIGRPDSNKKPE